MTFHCNLVHLGQYNFNDQFQNFEFKAQYPGDLNIKMENTFEFREKSFIYVVMKKCY